jgi:hypothetical protein
MWEAMMGADQREAAHGVVTVIGEIREVFREPPPEHQENCQNSDDV